MTKITLYTYPGCPWAQRVQIALAELGLKFEEVIIDINTPREPWYLEINPRGLVPALKYGDYILTESDIITQFLADLKASHLLPNPGNLEGALARARISYFVDTFTSKVFIPLFSSMKATSEEEKTAKVNQFLDAIEKEIIPLLKDAAPFFGGSKEFTLAEVNVAPFVTRIYAFSKPGVELLPEFVGEKLREIKVWQSWADAVLVKSSVTESFDEEKIVEGTKLRFKSVQASK